MVQTQVTIRCHDPEGSYRTFSYSYVELLYIILVGCAGWFFSSFGVLLVNLMFFHRSMSFTFVFYFMGFLAGYPTERAGLGQHGGDATDGPS